MTRADTNLIAEAFSYAEAITEMSDVDGIGAATLRVAVDAVAGQIKKQHPRFDVGAFTVAALPRQNARLREAIIAAVGGDAS